MGGAFFWKIHKLRFFSIQVNEGRIERLTLATAVIASYFFRARQVPWSKGGTVNL